MGFNETCAYLHTRIADNDGNGFGIEFNYDAHYCKYFENKSSRWTLELSDAYLETLGTGASVLIDGRKSMRKLEQIQVLEIPAGLGVHKIDIIGKL